MSLSVIYYCRVCRLLCCIEEIAMNFTLPIFSTALPEIVLLCLTSLVLLVDAFLTERTRIVTYILAQVTLVITLLLTVAQYREYPDPIITFSGNYILDKMAVLTKLFVIFTTIFAFIYARQ